MSVRNVSKSKANRARRHNATPTRLRIAIISDIHAYEEAKPDNAPSHCQISDNDPKRNALVGLREFVRANNLIADVLVCPGDLGDRGHPASLQHVWRELHGLRADVGASSLFATTGNHDVDSRYLYNDYDAKGVLQALAPQYPFDDESSNDRYWSRHFEVFERGCLRLVVLNSSAFHGEGQYEQTKCFEREHGRVSSHTLVALERALQNSQRADVNVLLCHHHPHLHAELRLGADDLMRGGQELIALLGSGVHGEWLVIHGHKHHPKLERAAGTSSAPMVFAAGSAAAFLYGELQSNCRNQFYIVEFPIQEFDKHGFVATFEAWDWASGYGWTPAAKNQMLPAAGGFGWKGSIRALSRVVAKAIATRAATSNSVKWADLQRDRPELKYMLPLEIKQLVQDLVSKERMVAEPANEYPPVLIGRQ